MTFIKKLLKLILIGFLSLIILGVVISFMSGQGQEEYDANKEAIMAEINGHIDAKRYEQALTLIKRNRSYDASLYELQKDVEVTQITEKLRTIPVSEFSENLSLYKRLVNLRPDNQSYKDKVAFYQQKLDEARAEQQRAQEAADKKRREDLLNPPWELSRSTDKMTDEESVYISSSRFNSISPMKFPYEGVRSWIGIGCDAKSRWAYIGFSESPNLNDTDTQDGYNEIRTQVRFDDDVKVMEFTQKWGADFLHLRDDETFINRLRDTSLVRLALNWHGQQTVYFDYQMHKFEQVFKEFETQCANL